MLSMFQKQCFKCANYIVVEEKVGYCKLFDNFKNARENKKLCGPEAKWFKPIVKKKEEEN